MTRRIFRAICTVALAVLLASLVLIMGVLYNYFSDIQLAQLENETALAAQGIAGEGLDFFQNLDAQHTRITWIAADGNVLYDSQSETSDMENHLQREEIQEALETGRGSSVRYSSTLLGRHLYAAQRLPDGSVLRLSSTQQSVLALTLGILQPTLLVIVIALILALLFASRLAKKIVAPLNNINLDDPLSNRGYDELAPLLRRLDSQQRQIRHQSRELQRMQEEFRAATGNMREGLVLLNPKGAILSINCAAAQILGTDAHCIGQDILTINRSLALQEILQKAGGGQFAEQHMSLDGREYQLDASPVSSGDTVSGTALLIFDITEKSQAEQLRREFTANVSHELKTPLHSISGCAELLLHDMVKPEDRKTFTGQIYTEAQRMIRLVDDIIRLSHLDEGAEGMPRETVDLYALAEAVCTSLTPEAEAARVQLHLEGGSATIHGIPQLLSGIVYNLCDNAIKYNRPDGQVWVEVVDAENQATLTVRDTGIGISPEHQSRIFERFYRVDKSHSKEVGGTGLGLSIVKHAVRLHHARLDLQSTPGQGTTFTISFPKQ